MPEPKPSLIRWWGWLDLFGRALFLIGLILQLEALPWLAGLHDKAFLLEIIENQIVLYDAIDTGPDHRKLERLASAHEIYKSLEAADRQLEVGIWINIGLVCFGSLGVIVARFFELKESN